MTRKGEVKMPVFYSDNPIKDAEGFDEWCEERAKKRPVCEKCKERIMDDYSYEIDGLSMCFECFSKYCEEMFRVKIEID